MKIDLLYLAKDRFEFTQESFTLLLENTNWDLVNMLFVVDDNSKSSSAAKWLQVTSDQAPVKTQFHSTNLSSPVGVMLYYLDHREAEYFAKVDNDICLPPGWLEAMTSVIERYDLDLLGMEAGRSGEPPDDWDGIYSRNKDCSHIGGVGLIRGTAIRRSRRPVPNGRFGWTENQHQVPYTRAWIKPDLQMYALDQVPREPWTNYSYDYYEQGIQRFWSNYPKEMTWYWNWRLGEGVIV